MKKVSVLFWMGSRATMVPGDPQGKNPEKSFGSLLDGVPGHHGPWDTLGPT